MGLRNRGKVVRDDGSNGTRDATYLPNKTIMGDGIYVLTFGSDVIDKSFGNDESIETYYDDRNEFDNHDRMVRIYEHFKILTPIQKEVMQLFLQKYNFEQIGEMLGIKSRTANEHYRHACKKIRKAIKKEDVNKKDSLEL